MSPTTSDTIEAPRLLGSSFTGPARWDPRRAAPMAVLLITALGMLLRFWDLGHQSPWIDESTTAFRISGSYADLLETLRNQGFGPLWYTMLYGFVHFMEKLTGSPRVFEPAILRLVPALCGSLVVPGMYFLARQFPPLAEHKWALLAAFLAAINPYSVYYSRDLKMYGLLLTLFTWQIAWFWRFQRTRRQRDFWPAAITFVIATLVHGTAWWLAIVHLVTIFARRRGHLRLILFTLLMWLLAAIGPAMWYAWGTEFLTRFADEKGSAGLGWIQQSFELKLGLLIESPAIFLSGLAIPQLPPEWTIQHFLRLGDHFTVNWRLGQAIEGALILLAAVIAVGIVPWSRWFGRPTRETGDSISTGVLPTIWLWCWATLPIMLLAMMCLPEDNPLSIYPHYMIYQPRYVAVCWPAWVMILTLSLRHLPSWKWAPLRIIAAAAASVILLASSLTNQLTYRLPPHAATAQMAAPYFHADDPGSLLILESTQTATAHSAVYAVETAFGLRPQFDIDLIVRFDISDSQLPAPTPIEVLDTIGAWTRSLRQLRHHSQIKTLVMTDRLADTPMLTDAEVLRMLGDGWRLVAQRSYRLNYEWHPYISHGFRTRVWQRVPASK